jgi:hypothetical protein
MYRVLVDFLLSDLNIFVCNQKGDIILVFGNLIKDNEFKKVSTDAEKFVEKNMRPANKKLIEQAKKYEILFIETNLFNCEN